MSAIRINCQIRSRGAPRTLNDQNWLLYHVDRVQSNFMPEHMVHGHSPGQHAAVLSLQLQGGTAKMGSSA